MTVWASYRRGGERTHSPVGSGQWGERLSVAYDAEPEWVVLVDRVIAELIEINGVYGDISKRYYLGCTPAWAVAEKVRRPLGFVLLSLRGICARIEERLPDLDVRGK